MKRTNILASEITATKFHICKAIKCRKELTITSESYKTKTEAEKHVKRGYIVANKKAVIKMLSEGWVDTQAIAQAVPQNNTIESAPKTATQLKQELNAECTVAEYEEYKRFQTEARATKKSAKQHTNTYNKGLTESQIIERQRYNKIMQDKSSKLVESITEPKKARQTRKQSQKSVVMELLPQLIANKKWTSLLQASADQLGFIGLIVDTEAVLELKGYKVSRNLEKWVQNGIVEYFKVASMEVA